MRAPDVSGSALAANDKGSWVIDLDGVIWLAGEPIAGVGEAIERLRASGARVLFASNNSSPTIATLVGRLERAGIEALPHEVVTSSQAAASMIEPGQSALVLGDDGVVEALEARGVRAIVADSASGADAAVPDVDVVVVGWTHRFDFSLLAVTNRAVRGGARLIGTNEDPTHPTPDGLLPGAGALLAAVATAAGTTPEVAGKPHEPLARLIGERAGHVAAVVGDRPSTDGALAAHLGAPFALVLSGVTAPGDPLPVPAPAVVAPDLLAVVQGATA